MHAARQQAPSSQRGAVALRILTQIVNASQKDRLTYAHKRCYSSLRVCVLGGSGNIRMLDLSPHSFVSEVVTNDSHHPRQGSVQAKGRVRVRLNAPVDQKPRLFLCISSYSYSSNGLYLANSILNAASPCVNDRTASAYPIRFESGTSA